MSAPQQPSQVLLWSQGRTACHLLERMLSKQDSVHYLPGIGHPFAPARPSQIPCLREESVASGIPDELRKPYQDAITMGTEVWREHLKQAQAENKTLFIHEHPHFALAPEIAVSFATKEWNRGPNVPARNYTLVPDELMLLPGTVPIFAIRHPALIIPAAFRAMSAYEDSANRCNLIVASTLNWARELHDWYLANSFKPLVAEAEDYMTGPEVVKELAREAGLSVDQCIFEWPAATKEEQAKMMPRYVQLQQSLLDSTGLLKGKDRKNVVIEDEIQKWTKEFGEADAAFVKEMVDASMPHYEYLVKWKVKSQ